MLDCRLMELCMLKTIRVFGFILIFFLVAGCSSNDESVFKIHGISIGTGYDKADKILKEKGFSIFKDEGKNFVEYRLDNENEKASLMVLYNSKNSNGQIYSIRFSTITHNYNSLAEAELLLKKMFGEKLQVTKRKSDSIIATSSEETSYGMVTMQVMADINTKLIGSVKLKNGTRGFNQN